MRKSIKTILVVLLSLVGLLVAYIVFNQFDVGRPADEFTAADISPAYFGNDNGFYLLFGMREPADLDITGEGYRMRIRHLFDPAFDNDRYIKEYPADDKDPGGWLAKWKTRKYPGSGYSFTRNLWVEFYKTNREEYTRIKETWKILLSRYELLMNSARFEDFTLTRADVPIPNLLLLLWAARVNTGTRILEAVDGKWLEGTLALIRQVDFAKRVVAGSRTLILNLIGKAVMRISLEGLISIMNERDCPADVFSAVLEKLPPLAPEDFGTRQGFICEYLVLAGAIEKKKELNKILEFGESRWLAPVGGWLLQKNRTRKDLLSIYRRQIALEKLPPYRWQAADFRVEPPARKFLWWLQNPTGKVLIREMTPNLKTVVYKSYRGKVLLDLTRIIAELNLAYTPEKPVAEILESLPSYKALDPFSGKPYRYNAQKQVIYSLGWDRVDDDGMDDPGTLAKSDIAAPCIPFYRPAREKARQ